MIECPRNNRITCSAKSTESCESCPVQKRADDAFEKEYREFLKMKGGSMSEGYQPDGPATNEVTSPNCGSHVKHPELISRKAGSRMVLQVLDTLETSVNRYVNDYDPCPICANKTETGHEEICHDCAYFYAGQFKAREADKC